MYSSKSHSVQFPKRYFFKLDINTGLTDSFCFSCSVHASTISHLLSRRPQNPHCTVSSSMSEDSYVSAL